MRFKFVIFIFFLIWVILIVRIYYISIKSNNSEVELELDNIIYPKKLTEEINNLKMLAWQENQNNQKEPVNKNRQERIKHIAYLLENVDNDSIIEIERLLEKKEKNKSLNILFNNQENNDQR